MGANVDSSFIRRAVECADLNAVKVTLSQHTRDPELNAMPVAAKMSADDKEKLMAKAVAWLEQNAAPTNTPGGKPNAPDEAELRRLMNLATGETMPDLEFITRRELTSFTDFPTMVEWQGKKPDLPKDFLVAIIGSGFSGIAAGVQMERLGLPYVVLERQPEAGGTWTINRYPDVRVDTSSNTYEFAFEKDWRWSEYFGRGAEVRAYLAHVSKKFGVFAKTRFSRDVQEARFDEQTSKWVLTAGIPGGGTETVVANFVITATGTFANPRFPAFAGAESFKGDILHPTRWPEGYDLAGRRVAIIGNGSTGVQLLAPIAEVAAHVDVYQRTPQWISPRPGYGKPIEPEVRWLIDHFPGYWNWWRYMGIASLFETHQMVLFDEAWRAKGGLVNPANDKLRETLTAYLKSEVGGRQDLIDKLLPDYAPFSRRPVVDNGWYRALTRDNVELVTDGIERLTPTGIVASDGTERPADVIVAATGFDVVRYLAPASFKGKGGLDLHEFWNRGDGPRAYLSLMVPDFPNMFMLYGPNSQPVSGGTPLPIWYALWSAYAAQCIMRVIEEGKSRVEVTVDAYQRYNQALDKEARKLIHVKKEGAAEKNYYVHPNGRLQVNAPFYGPEFHKMCMTVDWNDVVVS